MTHVWLRWAVVSTLLAAGCGMVGEEGAESAADGHSVEEPESPVTAASVYVVTDIELVASNSSTPPPGPYGWARIGYWDVDDGGAVGTFGSSGEYMMAMYARRRSADYASTCVEEALLYASDESYVPSSIWPNLSLVGYWDVDDGGGQGSNGSSGSYMMGLYVRKGPVSNGNCIQNLTLAASNSSQPSCTAGWYCVGWWDVDDGGGKGNNDYWGDFMMTLSALRQ